MNIFLIWRHHTIYFLIWRHHTGNLLIWRHHTIFLIWRHHRGHFWFDVITLYIFWFYVTHWKITPTAVYEIFLAYIWKWVYMFPLSPLGVQMVKSISLLVVQMEMSISLVGGGFPGWRFALFHLVLGSFKYFFPISTFVICLFPFPLIFEFRFPPQKSKIFVFRLVKIAHFRFPPNWETPP